MEVQKFLGGWVDWGFLFTEKPAIQTPTQSFMGSLALGG